MLTSAVFADSSSVTSKKYVDDFMTGYQNKIPGSGTNKLMIYDSNESDGINQKAIVSSLGENTSATDVPNVGAVKAGMDGKQDTINGTAGYVMTGTGYDGTVGEKPIYGTSAQYSSALVTAETVNTAVTNAVNGSLIRVDENGYPSNTGTLWEISDDLIALSVCSNYADATGAVVQNGTPTPTNPIAPFFYQQGDMILRAVGDYADSYDANTNKITRRVGVKVLNGTETFARYSGTTADSGYLFYSDNAISDNMRGQSVLPNTIIVSHFMPTLAQNPSSWTSGLVRFQGNKDDGTSTNRIYFSSNLGTPGDWKQWLAGQYAAGTPVVVYYPLETPVTEDMPPRCQ